jgi:hypothetical protein
VIGRWRRLGVVFPLGGFVLGAWHRRAGPVDGGWRRVWRPGFCGNDDGGSDVGDAAMVAVVGSSSACPRFCLGLFVAKESKLRRRGPVVYDDWLQVFRSAISRGASRAWFCPTEFSVRVRVASSGRRWLRFWHRSSCSFTCPLLCGLGRRSPTAELESFAQSVGMAMTPLGEE